MTTRLLLAAVAATASLVAACGGDEQETPTQSVADKSRQSMLDYARCMRSSGIDMPDPKFEGGRVTMGIGGPGQKIDETKLRGAEKACAKYREQMKPPELSDEERGDFKQAALENAKCMRENGVPKFPDPTFDENGGARLRMDKSSGIDPESPAFKKAMEQCQDTMGDGPTTKSVDEH